MEFLTDSDLKVLLAAAQPPISGINLASDLDAIDSQVQPCSVDLRINEIFLPADDALADVNAVRRTYRHDLGVGQSVKVSTLEEFDLNNQHGALLFAPARLSRRGIVVPDIGHIDPGFKGPIRLTLINMGRDPYCLKKDDTIATVLLFRLSKKCAVGLLDRKGSQPYAQGLEDIKHLSKDFLNITRTTNEVAGREARRILGESGWKYAFVVFFLPIIIGLLSGFATYYIEVQSKLDKFQTDIEAKVSSLEKSLEVRADTTSMQIASAKVESDLNSRLIALQKELDETRDSVADLAKKHAVR